MKRRIKKPFTLAGELASELARHRWKDLAAPERSKAVEPARRAVIKYWAAMTSEERSAELKRRAKVRAANRAKE